MSEYKNNKKEVSKNNTLKPIQITIAVLGSLLLMLFFIVFYLINEVNNLKDITKGIGTMDTIITSNNIGEYAVKDVSDINKQLQDITQELDRLNFR